MRANFSQWFPVMVAVCALIPAFDAAADASKVWDLRNLYKIPVEHGVLIYAEDNAEWRVLMDDGQVLADRIGFSIQLSDGTEYRGIGLEDGTSNREVFTEGLGEGTVYSVTFPAKNGLKIVHSLKTFRARPFVFIEISVENVGISDVKIAAIRPVIAEKSVMQALSAQATVRHRRVLDTGGQPVAGPEQDATMALIYDPAEPICFGVGLIPTGLARSTVAFKEAGGEWHGDISCNYEPYKLLKPGETLVSDPLWISHGVSDPDRVDLNYSWAYSTLVDVPKRKFDARGWYTLASEKGLDAYIAAGSEWKQAGVDHVLIGRGWEGRPGSMEGASGRFPKSMKQAVTDLNQAKLSVGILIDPLSAKEGGTNWTATSADGLAWLNPALPEAKAALADTVKTLKDWGAAFVVVDYSVIPDDVLAGFGLTRAEAQNLAYKAFREAADPLPVFPSSVSTVSDKLDEWLDAGSAVAQMSIYGMMAGPLRCTLGENANITTDLMTAMQFWPGPIEFVGTTGKKQRDAVQSVLKEQRIAAHPLDAGNDAPRIWRLQRHDASGKMVEDRTIPIGDVAIPPTNSTVLADAPKAAAAPETGAAGAAAASAGGK